MRPKAHVFRLGPFSAGRDGEAYAYVAVDAEAEQILDNRVEKSDGRGLGGLIKRCTSHALIVEPTLEKIARERGLEIGVLPPEVLEIRAMMAMGLAQRIPPDRAFEALPALVEAALAFEAAEPWERLEADQPLVIEVAGRIYEACVIGQMGESFGLVLYPEPGSLRRVMETDDPRGVTRSISMLSLELSWKPEFALDPVREAFGLESIPTVMKLDRGRPSEPSADDMLAMAAAMKAAAALDGTSAEVEASVLSGSGVEWSARALMMRPVPFTPEVIAGGKGKVGRNDPCPCGSGKKYKKCCIAKKAAAPKTPAERAQALHTLDGELVRDILAFAERRWPGWSDSARAAFTDGKAPQSAEIQLEVPWLAYCAATPDGQSAVTRYAMERGATLDDEKRVWVAAQLQSVLSVLEVIEAHEGEGLELTDLFTKERAFVQERSGSSGIRPRTVLLGRVVHAGGVSVLCGLHPRALDPRTGEQFFARMRKKLGMSRAENPRDVLFEPATSLTLIRSWRDEIAAMDAPELGLEPTVLQNTDGDPFLWTEDRYDIAEGARDRALETLRALPGAEIEAEENGEVEISFAREGNAFHRDWENTVIGSARLDRKSAVVTTNAIARADALRSEIERRGEGALRHRARIHPTLPLPNPPPHVKGPLRLDMQRVRSPETAARMARDYYRGWIDAPHPLLDGLTPRQAVKEARRRRVLHGLLKEVEFQEAGGIGVVEWVRRELGLSETGELEALSPAAKMAGRGSKISETILDFGEPMITALGADAFALSCALAIEIWNEAVWAELGVPPARTAKGPGDASPTAAMRSAWTEILRARKRALFSGDHRVVVDWSIHERDEMQSLGAAFAPAETLIAPPVRTRKRKR